MTTFQMVVLLLTLIWLCLVLIRFQRSTIVLIGGLILIGLVTLVALVLGKVSPAELGLGKPDGWSTLGFALAGLAVMLAYSPLADRLASGWIKQPPTLQAFGTLQESSTKLILGIILAWLLGACLEELVARGLVLTAVQAALAPSLSRPLAAGIAILIAALGAGAMHRYQGPRAMLIITQLSLLFGLLYVFSGYNLWAVMLCHGLYDTIAFIRFASGKSRYSNLGEKQH